MNPVTVLVVVAVVAVVAVALAGFYAGAAAQARDVLETLAARERALSDERHRLDLERRRLADLMVARTAREAADLDAARGRAEQPAPPQSPPPPWANDPRVVGFNPKLVTRQGRQYVQLRQGQPGNERIVEELPIETFLPRGSRLDITVPSNPAD